MAGTYKLYNYVPSTAAALIFVVVFGILFIAHTFQIFRSRGWYFTAMAAGALMEAIGYVGRYLGHNDTTSIGPYIMQTLLLLVAPSLFSASIYMVLGRLITVLGAEGLSVIRVTRLTKFFVLGDVLSFLIQGGGGGLMASDSQRDMGQKIILGGLGIQVLWFGGFIVVSAVFHIRMRKYEVPAEQRKWTRLMFTLYAASALILIRCIFRLIEFGGGRDGTLMSNEVYLYIFDAVLMTITVALFNVFHPPTYIREMSYATTPLMEKGMPLRQRTAY